MNKGNAMISSFEVIQWVLEQTCNQLEKLQPLWAWQGLQHFRCNRIWDEFKAKTNGFATLPELVSKIQETESKSLLQLYAPWAGSPYSIDNIQELSLYHSEAPELMGIWERAASATTQLHEEQEREVTQEIQREQHICRPPPVKPLKHFVHSDLQKFVKKGRFPQEIASEAVRQAFECLLQTSAAQFKVPRDIGQQLWATKDFLNTIETDNSTLNDEFLKPVHWVLSNIYNQQLIIISQHEANALLPDIRASDKVTLHMYAPRTAKDMCSFSKLDFLTIGNPRNNFHPAPEVIQALEILSGSLYFDTFAEYEGACHFFGFITDNIQNIPEGSITSEGFVDARARIRHGWPVKSPFTESPLPLLKSWYGIRMKGHGFSQSHVGTILDARRLKEEQF